MAPVPYVIQRIRKLYLRVRIPTDIVPLARRTHLVRSLGTSDPRRARGETARLLAAVHDAWETMRRDVIKIAGRVLDELLIDDIPTLRPEDVAVRVNGPETAPVVN